MKLNLQYKTRAIFKAALVKFPVMQCVFPCLINFKWKEITRKEGVNETCEVGWS